MITPADLIKGKRELDAALAARPDDVSVIGAFRRGCICLLEGADLDGCDSAELKFAVSICADCCRTRIAVCRTSGAESVFPAIASEDERSFCIHLYDRCTARLKELDRFYLPDQIERVAPDRQKLSWLIRQSLSEGNSAKMKAQQDGKQFSRLFGSRG